MRIFWIALLAICTGPAKAGDYTLTLALISGSPTLEWHEAALETQDRQPFGEGCMFLVDRPFVQAMADIASAGTVSTF